MAAFSDIASSSSATKPLINLLRGWPNPSLLPISLVDKASHSVLNDASLAVPAMCYGPDPGDSRLRKTVAKWLTDFYQPSGPGATTGQLAPVSEERITITGGASQNLACLLQVFTDPLFTRNVWIVSPSYMLAFRIFEDSGFATKLRAVPEDEEGIDIEYLGREMKKSEEKAVKEGNTEPLLKPNRPWSKSYKHIIYAVPTFSNPSSKTMSLARREALVRLARQYDALIITDDVYDFLQWENQAPSSSSTSRKLEKAILPRIVDVDRYIDGGAEREGADGFGNAASNGSFSKIFGPGVRTGWCEGAGRLAYGVSQTGSTRSGGAPSHLTATFVAEALSTGDLQHFVYNTLQPSYAQRYHTMLAAINEHLIPLGVVIPQTDREVVGGYFVWLTLPGGLRGDVVARSAREGEELVVAEGGIFEVPGDAEHAHFENALRVCFAWEEEEKLTEGIERLARVIRLLQEEGGQATQNPVPGQEAEAFW